MTIVIVVIMMMSKALKLQCSSVDRSVPTSFLHVVALLRDTTKSLPPIAGTAIATDP